MVEVASTTVGVRDGIEVGKRVGRAVEVEAAVVALATVAIAVAVTFGLGVTVQTAPLAVWSVAVEAACCSREEPQAARLKTTRKHKKQHKRANMGVLIKPPLAAIRERGFDCLHSWPTCA